MLFPVMDAKNHTKRKVAWLDIRKAKVAIANLMENRNSVTNNLNKIYCSLLKMQNVMNMNAILL